MQISYIPFQNCVYPAKLIFVKEPLPLFKSGQDFVLTSQKRQCGENFVWTNIFFIYGIYLHDCIKTHLPH